MDQFITWIKSNKLIAIAGAIVAILIFFPRVFKKLLGTTHRRRVRRAITGSYRRPRRRSPRRVQRVYKARRSPRPSRRGRKAKPAWMIKGSRAARLRMARLRRMRS
jgi:hypothetical protein